MKYTEEVLQISDDFKGIKPIFRIRELVKFWNWSTGIDLFDHKV